MAENATDKEIHDWRDATDKRMDAIEKKLDDIILNQNKTNWPILIGALTFLAIVIGAIFFTLDQTNQVASLKQQIATEDRIRPVLLSAEDSKTDRGALNHKVETNISAIAALEAKIDSSEAALAEKLREVETQMKGVENAFNLQLAYNHNTFALLWKKSYGEPFPTAIYYPSFHRN